MPLTGPDPVSGGASNNVLDLSQAAAVGPASGATVVSQSSRLQVTASLDISTAAASKGDCQAYQEVSTAQSGTPIGHKSYYTIPATTGDSDRQVPIVASVSVPAGTYDVFVLCEQTSGSGATYDSGDLNVVAIAL